MIDRAPATRGICLALGLLLAFEPGRVAAAPPSERDLAYEQGLRAEEAGDDAAAAQHFARAYRLTAPAETGPRLLFLRASVAAHLRAHAGAPDAIEPLCQARALLREHLAPGQSQPALKDSSTPTPPADLGANLERIEQQLGGRDCSQPAADPTPPSVDPRPAAEPAGNPVPEDSPKSTPTAPPAVPVDTPPDPRRALRIAGAANLGVGAAGFATMGVGIGLAQAAERRGYDECATICFQGDNTELFEARADGERANKVIVAGAMIGGIETVVGIVLLAVSARVQPRRPLALVPRVAPGSAGISLSGRF